MTSAPDLDLTKSPSTTPEHVQVEAGSVLGENGEGTGGSASSEPAKARKGHRFNSETARQGALRKAFLSRERKAAAAEDAKLATLTARQRMGIALAELSIDDMRLIRDGLVTKAKAGDEKAVNALARLLDQSFGRAGNEPTADPRSPEEKPWSEWTAAERAEYRSALLAERARLRGEIEPKGDESDPRTPESTL